MNRVTLCLALVSRCAVLAAADNSAGRLVQIGGHQLYVDCSGAPSEMTVVLVNGLGAGLETWQKVQSDVEKFSRVCSYDRAGEGHSDKISHLQTADEIVSDLWHLLEHEKVPGPYVLVGASLGGIYVRRFAQRYPHSIAGIVLVDSSHEEQYNRYAAISPAVAERYATQDGRFNRDELLRAAGQLEPGRHLEWHQDVPLIVLEHKRLAGPPRNEPDRLAVDWHEMQADLAARSKFGKLIEIRSGHMIAAEQPEVVVESIQEIIRQARR